jgi:hypothetical protein
MNALNASRPDRPPAAYHRGWNTLTDERNAAAVEEMIARLNAESQALVVASPPELLPADVPDGERGPSVDDVPDDGGDGDYSITTTPDQADARAAARDAAVRAAMAAAVGCEVVSEGTAFAPPQ